MSIGLTRLFYVLNEINLIKTEKKAISDILVVSMVEDLSYAIKTANELRKAGINTEVYFDDKKIKAKFKYADKLKIPYVVVIGEDEINTGKLTGTEISVVISNKKDAYALKRAEENGIRNLCGCHYPCYIESVSALENLGSTLCGREYKVVDVLVDG